MPKIFLKYLCLLDILTGFFDESCGFLHILTDFIPIFLFENPVFFPDPLIFKAVDRRRNSALSINKRLAGKGIDRHNRRVAEQAAEFHRIAYAFPDHGDQPCRRGFLIHHS